MALEKTLINHFKVEPAAGHAANFDGADSSLQWMLCGQRAVQIG